MINLQELRVGNWYKDAGCGVTQMTPEKFDLWRGEFASPIPLTSEILVACGFKKNGFNEYEIEIKLSNGCEYSTMDKKLFFSGDYLYLEEWRDSKRSHERDITTLWNKDLMKEFYLHLLQNLYYSLTGNELEYKPVNP